MNNEVHNIYHFNAEKTFTEDQAYEIVNLLLPVTKKSKNLINSLNSRLEYYKARPKLADQVQLELNQEIQKWSDKMRRLGTIPLSLYEVKIPCDGGHYYWKFPSVELKFLPQ